MTREGATEDRPDIRRVLSGSPLPPIESVFSDRGIRMGLSEKYLLM
jgi:hypothetical protein